MSESNSLFVSSSIDDFMRPGVVVEVKTADAERMGAFVEDAITEADAVASNADAAWIGDTNHG